MTLLDLVLDAEFEPTLPEGVDAEVLGDLRDELWRRDDVFRAVNALISRIANVMQCSRETVIERMPDIVRHAQDEDRSRMVDGLDIAIDDADRPMLRELTDLEPDALRVHVCRIRDRRGVAPKR